MFSEGIFIEAHFREISECFDELKSDPKLGLTSEEAEVRLQKYGNNELPTEEPTPVWKLVLEQFDDLLVKILLGAAIISFVLASFEDHENEKVSAFVEPLVILLILIINAVVGVWQEHNAENALEALKNLQPKNTTVIRDGKVINEFGAERLVPGDLVEIHTGDKVPADMRIVEHLTTTLKIDQSAMTGESTTVLKQIHPVDGTNPEHEKTTFKKSMVFSGTVVVGGRARCLVVTTGSGTVIGGINEAVQNEEDDKTPLKIKLDEFGENLTWVIGLICIAVWIMNFNQFFDPVHGSIFKGCIYYFKIAVALGVAAIPEGLPAVITLCLALGTRKMVKKNCYIRHLPSVETLGCTTVICSDKTGTLTLNEMTAVKFVFVENDKSLSEHDVSGQSYNPAGHVNGIESLDENKDQGIINACEICSYCNDSNIRRETDEGTVQFLRSGEPTEAALKVLVEKLGAPNGASEGKSALPVNAWYASQSARTGVLEFSRGRKSMSVLSKGESGANVLYTKGAPESVIARCNRVRLRNGQTISMSPELRIALSARVNKLACTPLRTLAFAIKDDLDSVLASYDGSEEHPGYKMLCVPESDDYANTIEKDMVFVGLCGIKDPPRPQVKGCIELCKQAGIRVIMITGDKKETANAIAREIGIFSENEDILYKSFTGAEFFALSEAKQQEYLMSDKGGRVFSRADPTDKQRLVNLLKANNEVCAMTGDGVNDAPALKAASIGIAMGIAGTEVAKEAADMVLADDNFATIVSAVEEGRSIYSNMKAFIRYLISSNIGEVASIFLTAALGIPEGLIPVQLLWVNLVTDGPPATALGFNPADADVMRRPPRNKDDQLITGWVFFRYMVVGLYVGFATVGIFVYWYLAYDWADDDHTLVTFDQLSHWGHCTTWDNFKVNDFEGISFAENPCTYFTVGKIKASTLSLSVLVLIEMLNALNALSENGSLFHMPPWANPYLLLAIAASMAIHCVILYVPFMADIFQICALDAKDWGLVWAFSFPVIIIDEVLKFVGRIRLERQLAVRAAENKKHD